MFRLKSVDTFRGIAVIAMIWLHISEWWLSPDSDWFLDIPLNIVKYGFLVSYQFISGVSRYLYYRTGGSTSAFRESTKNQRIKREFLMRGVLLVIVALIYNSVVALSISRPSEIWSWFILLAVGFSIILITPILDTSKTTRISLAVAFMVINFLLLSFLQDHEGQTNIFGILYHLLFYPPELHPLLSSFAVFLIGTVVGEILYEIYYKAENQRKFNLLKKKLIFPSILIGVILITCTFILQSFLFLNLPSFYGILCSLGISLILISLFIFIEVSELIKANSKYNFIYYFSYYSLTIYLGHNLLYFLFYNRLDPLATTLFIIITIISIGLLLKLIYPKLGRTISIKKMISRLSTQLIIKLDGIRESDQIE